MRAETTHPVDVGASTRDEKMGTAGGSDSPQPTPKTPQSQAESSHDRVIRACDYIIVVGGILFILSVVVEVCR